MPWKETTTMEQKVEFISAWRSQKHTITELCRTFNISRPTAYKMINRFEKLGIDGLIERKRSPKNHPNKSEILGNSHPNPEYFVNILIYPVLGKIHKIFPSLIAS